MTLELTLQPSKNYLANSAPLILPGTRRERTTGRLETAFVVSQCGRPSRLNLSIFLSATVTLASRLRPCMTACCMRKRLLSRLGLHERPRVSSERASLMYLLNSWMFIAKSATVTRRTPYPPTLFSSVPPHWTTPITPGQDSRWRHSTEPP